VKPGVLAADAFMTDALPEPSRPGAPPWPREEHPMTEPQVPSPPGAGTDREPEGATVPERPDAVDTPWGRSPSPAPSADAWASGPPAATPVDAASNGHARRRSPAAAIAAILALALLAGSATYLFLRSDGGATPGATGGGPSTLALAFDRGDDTTFDMHLTMNGTVDLGAMGSQPLDLDMHERITWDVVRVAPDGTATVRISSTTVSGSVGGVEAPVGSGDTSMTVTVTPDGRILDADGMALGSTGSFGGGFPGMNQITPILPDHPVEPGDTWDKHFSTDMPFADGKLEYTAHSTFLRYDTVGTVRTAVVQTRYTLPFDFSFDMGKLGAAFGATDQDLARVGGHKAVMTFGGRGTFEQTSWLDLGAKQLVKADSSGDFDMTISMPAMQQQLGSDGFEMKASFSMRLTRV
jgi:hypothetical protein